MASTTIHTKYHIPTNTRASRITAHAAAVQISVPYDHDLNIEDNHIAAAKELTVRLGWNRASGALPAFVTGCLPDGSYAHVFT